MIRCCGIEITSNNYDQHCKHHLKNNERLPCPLINCKSTYKTKENLEKHFGRAHQEVIPILLKLALPPSADFQQVMHHL